MSLDAKGYFNALRASLNTSFYEINPISEGVLQLKEKVFTAGSGSQKKEYKVSLNYTGEVIAIKLDKVMNGSMSPLFHFLNDSAKPWSKRCDFVIFNLVRNQIKVYCIEFKSGSIPIDTHDQLKASLGWCKALHATIKSYTGESRKLNLTKFVFSETVNIAAFTDANGYLNRDHTVRHYLYTDVIGFSLSDLINTNVEEIK